MFVNADMKKPKAVVKAVLCLKFRHKMELWRMYKSSVPNVLLREFPKFHNGNQKRNSKFVCVHVLSTERWKVLNIVLNSTLDTPEYSEAKISRDTNRYITVYLEQK